MKQFRLFILLCLLASPALSQNDLNGDSLASDFRYLVKLLEATHPDPYSGFGGKVFFHEVAFRIENELKRATGSRQSFSARTCPTRRIIEEKRADFIKYCMCSVPEKLQELQGKPLYAPEHIYVVTNDRTFSAAFHFTFYFVKNGSYDCRCAQRTGA